MANREQAEGLLKIGALARAAGVSVSTAKFYAKEGLIRAAVKTGRNMAYYDPACVETIRRIRALQRERFYPLSVIKGLLESPAVGRGSWPAGRHPQVRRGGRRAPSPGRRGQGRGPHPAQTAELVRAGLIDTEGVGRRQTVSPSGQAVMALVGRRLEAGIPFAQSLRAFAIYQEALDRAAAADVDSFVAGALMARSFTAEAGAEMIRVSDETLDAFIDIRRREMNRIYGSRRLEDLDRFPAAGCGAAGAGERRWGGGLPQAAAPVRRCRGAGTALPQVRTTSGALPAGPRGTSPGPLPRR